MQIVFYGCFLAFLFQNRLCINLRCRYNTNNESLMCKLPIVSVIIPFYNVESNIKETMESALSQSYGNLEIICVDDGSKDKSAEIINEIASHDHRVKLLKRERFPKSGSTCRNIGAFHANGEYLIFLDADDVLAPDCIENRLKVIEGSSYDFVVFPMASFTNEINSWIMTSRLKVKDFKYFFASGFAAWQVTSPIWRKSFFVNDLKGFNESFQRLQDIELHLRAIVESVDNFLVMKDNVPDCFYRKSSSKKILQCKMLKSLEAYEQFAVLLDNIKNKGFFKERKRFSVSILIMCLTMLCTINLLFQNGVYDYNRQRITKIDLIKDMQWYDRAILKMLLTITNPRLGFMSARLIRRLCQYRFY